VSDNHKPVLRLWIELLRASNAIKKDLDARLRAEFGQSLSRFDLLSALHRAGDKGLRAGDISDYLLVTDGATSQLSQPLVKDGLVQRSPCPDDRRSAIFTLTPQGCVLFERMAERHSIWVARRFEDLTDRQVTELIALVRAIDLAPTSRQTEGELA